MNLEKVLKNLTIAGLFIIPFVPLIITYSLFFPFITGKAFTFRIVVGIIFLLWLALVLLNKEYLPKKSWILYSLISFLGILGLATVFGSDPYRSFWSNFERMEGFITLLYLGAFFLVASTVMDEKWWWRFFHVSLGVSCIVSFYGFFQLTGLVDIRQGGTRLDGTMGNAIYLAVYLMFHIFIALYYFLQRKNSYKYFYLALIFFQSFILYNTATRGAILALIGGIFLTLLLIFVFEKERKSLKKFSGAFLLAIIILISGFWFARDLEFVKKSPVLSRFSSLSIEEIKEQGRFFIWPMAVRGAKERPVLGWGQENFTMVFSNHYNPKMYSHEPWFDRVHNVYLDWLIAGGFLGLAAFLLIIVSVLVSLWKIDKLSVTDKSVLTGLIAGYLIQGIFDFDNLTSYILIFSLFAYIYHLRTLSNPPVFNFKELRENTVRNFVLPAFLVLFLIVGYFTNYKPLLAAKNVVLAIQPTTPVDQILDYFRKTFELKTFGSGEVLIQLLTRGVRILNHPDASEDIKRQYLNFTQEQISNLSERIMIDARLLLTIGSFYNNIGLHDEALEFLNRAEELSPLKQDIKFEKGAAYFTKGEQEKAFEIFREAYDLEPRNPEAGIRFALALLLSGNQEEADEILSKLGVIAYSDDRILNTWVNLNRIDKVLEIWQVRVENNPENTEFRKPLVASYLTLRRWDEAIREIEKIIEMDPSFRETGEYAIGEIRAGRGNLLLE